VTPDSYAPSGHYDRVTAAWTLLLGEDLHYGIFASGDEDLGTATKALTQLMVEAARPEARMELLDVGCGTGAPACHLAGSYGVRVTGITTSAVGVDAARSRAEAAGVSALVSFEQRDGMKNGFPDASFDRVWVLESSHLMRRRDKLVAECARVLRPRGRLALCDIVLQREMPFQEVRRMREPLALLREVFGDARMEPLELYARLADEHGLIVEQQVDLTASTRPTFARWRDNAHRHRDEVVALLGQAGWRRFVEATEVLERFWDDGLLGYGLLAASMP
jgi:27-O-demethylrifamycin SV methyltransferase